MDPINILLVDDQPGKLLSYEAILSDLGANLVMARSGREALHCLLKDDFALILLDVVMPEMDGFETALTIRQRPRSEHTPIIFVTAYSTTELDRMKGYKLGAVDYVFAPIMPDILRAKVSAFIELYRKRQELATTNERLREEIAERERVQDRWRQSEERFRLMVDVVRDYGIFMLDPDGIIVTWNVGAERLTGYRSEQVLGQHFSLFSPEEEKSSGKLDAEMQTAIAEGRVEHETWRLRRDGTQFWASVVLTAMRNMNGDLVGFAEIIRDLTERRRAQEQAMQNERLAAIGEMVTGLAHESRNALQQIQACVEMLTRRLKTAPEIGLVTEIQKAHDRLFRLLEEVRGYAKPIKLERLPVDISKVWRQAWQQLAAQRNGSLAILEENVGDCSVNCLVDAFSIEQLFRNLFENSLAAANGALKVQVSCQPSHLDGQSAVRIRVADNGSGLTAEQKRRIFEPFYTTKSRGTGLGMAIAKRVVEAHGGRISVGELSGPGTAIDVTLPRGLS